MSDEDGAKNRWVRLSLVVHSETLTGEELSKALGIDGKSSDIGTPVSRRNPSVLRKHTTFSIDSNVPTTDTVQEHLASLLSVFEAHQEAFRSLTRSQAHAFFNASYSANGGQGETFLTHELIRRLADTGLDLSLDLGVHTDDDDEN
jgi:Domain of unknown function (DUF4279)